jgi:hypothetical protein
VNLYSRWANGCAKPNAAASGSCSVYDDGAAQPRSCSRCACWCRGAGVPRPVKAILVSTAVFAACLALVWGPLYQSLRVTYPNNT